MLLGIFMGFVLAGLALFIRGAAIAILWNWFIVPTFGLPVLTVWIALAISLMILTAHPVYPEEEKHPSVTTAIVRIFAPIVAVAIGFILKLGAGL